jgi:thioredoxin 1
MIKELTEKNFVDTIETKDKPVLVDFWAEWCGPCRMMSGRLLEIEKELSDKAVIAKVNIDNEELLSDSYNIQSIPTLMVFHNGKIVEEFVGLTSKEQLKKSLEKYIQ